MLYFGLSQIKLLWSFITGFLGKYKFSFLWDVSKGEIAGLCSKRMIITFLLRFQKKLPTVSQSAYHLIATAGMCERPSVTTSSPAFGVSLLFISAVLIDVYLISVLICISLLINDVEHLYICVCLFVIHLSFLLKCLFVLFAHFLIGLFYFLLLTALELRCSVPQRLH